MTAGRNNNGISCSAAIRATLDHPVIDSDGHLMEYIPAVEDALVQVAGRGMVERFRRVLRDEREDFAWRSQSPAERRAHRTPRPVFWGVPMANPKDLATLYASDLFYHRLDEFGIDFAVLYPGLGLTAVHLNDDEVRRATCRALNRYYAEHWGNHPDRMTPVAVIPMHTPEEALAELDYVVRELHLKAVLLPSYISRPIEALATDDPVARRHARWLDTFGLDSRYDYDAVWAKCAELKVVPSFHSRSLGWPNRASISNYVYNHIGHFAASAEALAKSLYLGGVTRRFPDLKFAFLEGGVGWARSLLADLMGHWEKRNLDTLEICNPTTLDRASFAALMREHAGKLLKSGELPANLTPVDIETPARSPELDDFRHIDVRNVEDIPRLFVDNFYFGCEADDPITSSAFDTLRNPGNVRLNAIFGSDIGHWDVIDMTEVVEEVAEMVDAGLLSDATMRDFVFTHPARMWGSNPHFFKGTCVEEATTQVLATSSSEASGRSPHAA